MHVIYVFFIFFMFLRYISACCCIWKIILKETEQEEEENKEAQYRIQFPRKWDVGTQNHLIFIFHVVDAQGEKKQGCLQVFFVPLLLAINTCVLQLTEESALGNICFKMVRVSMHVPCALLNFSILAACVCIYKASHCIDNLIISYVISIHVRR